MLILLLRGTFKACNCFSTCAQLAFFFVSHLWLLLPLSWLFCPWGFYTVSLVWSGSIFAGEVASWPACHHLEPSSINRRSIFFSANSFFLPRFEVSFMLLCHPRNTMNCSKSWYRPQFWGQRNHSQEPDYHGFSSFMRVLTSRCTFSIFFWLNQSDYGSSRCRFFTPYRRRQVL